MRLTGWWQRRAARRRSGQQLWREAEFCVLDFETTGLGDRKARPLSVGWVPVRGGRIVMAEGGYSLVRHGGAVPLEALTVHRLLPEDVATAPPVEEVAARLAAALNGRILVAHGVAIELAMLARCGVDVRRRSVIDTAYLSRSLERLEGRGEQRPQTLSALAARLGLPVHRPHHAFGDALTTAGVFLALASRLEGRGAATVAALRRLGHRRAWP